MPAITLPFQYQLRGGTVERLDGARLAQAFENRDRELEDFLASLQAQVDRLPRGVVATAVMNASPVLVAAAATSPLSSVLTFTPLLGRKYRIVFRCRAIIRHTGAGLSQARCDLQIDGVHIADNYQHVVDIGFSSITADGIFTGDGVSHGYRMFGSPSVDTDYYTDQIASGMYIEDMGGP